MEPAFRLRMRGDLLGRPGPSVGWGELCSARSGSSDAFPGQRFSILPWSVFSSPFYPTTSTDRRGVNGLPSPNPRPPVLLPPCTISKFLTTLFLNHPVQDPSTLTHLRRGWTESTASWGTAFFLNTFHSRAEVQLYMEPLLWQGVLWGNPRLRGRNGEADMMVEDQTGTTERNSRRYIPPQLTFQYLTQLWGWSIIASP